jgi:hypothetical protein
MTTTPSLEDVRTFPIPDVAALINVGTRRILDACRNDQLDHVNAGGRRSMTTAQIAAALRYFSTGVAVEKPSPSVDPLAQAKAQSRANARRRPRASR